MLLGAGNSKCVRLNKSEGLTLIELLVVVALFAIIATVAVPNFASLINRSSLTANYNSVLSSLFYAKSEAVRGREDVVVTISTSGSSWQSLVESDSRGVMRQVSGENPDISVQESVITFNALGRSSCSSVCSILVSHTDVSDGIAVQVMRSGRIGKPLESSGGG